MTPLQARGLCFAHPGAPPLFDGLDFDIGPGLTRVTGGDGRGKTTLLALIAGRLVPQAGRLQRGAARIAWPDAGDPAEDRTVAEAWLQAQAAVAPAWDADAAAQALEGFALAPHLPKQLHMLSTGTRRKLALVVALAGGATVTLLDTPFAALDAPSVRHLASALKAAAADRHRAWVLADPAPPPALDGVAWAGHIDLGD